MGMNAYCDGNALVTCITDHSERRTVLQRVECVDRSLSRALHYCVTVETDGEELGVCVRQQTPEAVCQGKHGTACDGSKVVGCLVGYVVEELEVCSTPHLCVEGVDRCVLQAEKDPLCANLIMGSVCDGDLKVDCYRGYRQTETPCSPHFCYAYESTESDGERFAMASCVDSLELDSRCGHLLTESYYYGIPTVVGCVGNTLLICAKEGMIVLRETDCGSRRCNADPYRSTADCE